MNGEASDGRDGTWSHFEHGADIGVRGEGGSLAAAFAQVATALTAVLTDPAGVRAETMVEVELTGADPELLLVDWLNAVVFEMTTRGMLFGRYEVRVAGGRLTARLWGEPVDRRRHQPAVEVKGATLTGLEVTRRPDGRWLAQCVVDV